MSQQMPALTVRRAVRRQAPWERVAFALLAVLACVLAHEATYLATYGGGRSLATAMTATGHDGYWLWLVAAVVSATVGLAVVAAWQLHRLRREAGTIPTASEDDGARGYGSLLAGVWVRLALTAGIMYTLQENAEALAAGLPVQGLDVLVRHGALPLLLILLATLIVAAVAALVHWRRLVLLGRLAAMVRSWARATARACAHAAALLPRASRVPAAHGSRAPPAPGRSLLAAH